MAYVTDRELATLVKSRLETKGRTQKELAEELRISEAYLSDFLNGRRGAGPTILRGLGYEPIPYYRPIPKASKAQAQSTDQDDDLFSAKQGE